MNGNLGGIEYSELEITVTVVVSDNGDGTLDVAITYDPETTTFTNVYTAQGSWTPQVTKVLTGRTLLEGEFEFEIWQEVEGGDDILIETVSNLADGRVLFDEIEYTLDDVGSHRYIIKEVNGNLGGVEYSELEITVTVVVTDNGDGTLDVAITYDPEDKTFTNVYSASGSWIPEADKVLTGRDLKAGEFEFVLLDEDGNEIEAVYNAADGSIIFSEIEYDESDAGMSYSYIIKEIVGEEDGMTYDDLEILITVTITDNGDGTLDVAVAYSDDTVFNNTYTADGSWIPIVAKELTGRDLKEGEFTFELREGEEVLLTTTNQLDGSVIFDEIEYTQDDIGKTFTYTIVEVVGELGGVTYDELIITVTVLVEDAGNGELKLTITYSDDKVFNNRYDASGNWKLMAKKVLEGRELIAGEFSFILRDDDGNILQTVTNTADGLVIFEEIEYTEAGTYHYELVEVTGDVFGVSYDETVYAITVTVTDNGDGTLEVVADFGEYEPC